MKKEHSLVKKSILFLLILILLLSGSVFTFAGYSLLNAKNQIEKSANDYLLLLNENLDGTLEDAEFFFEVLLYNNNNYEMLQSENESSRYMATYNLMTTISNVFSYSDFIDAIIISSDTYQETFGSKSSYVNYYAFESLREFNATCATAFHQKAIWQVEEIGGTQYVCKVYVWQGKATGIYIRLDNFVDQAAGDGRQNKQILLSDESGTVLSSFGQEILPVSSGDALAISQKLSLSTVTAQLDNIPLTVTTVEKVDLSIVSGHLGTLLIFVILLITLGFALWVRGFMKREIILPLRHMTSSMAKMEEATEVRIAEEYPNLEFETLRVTFNRLMDEIVGLRIRAYEKQIALSENELKTIRLQLRPHFFLNALTSISSLSMRGENEAIQTYIGALSKNIRYMFKSGLHTVKLSEELTHVENYFEMQELKFPGCVFYFIECEEELKGWQIPQMIIHTIIENEYKYAVSIDQVLTILIKITKVEKENEEMLCIQIEDDGKGYPEDVLEHFRALVASSMKPQSTEASLQVASKKDGSRVGLASIERMLRLMYEREDLFEIGNVTPHGCMNRFYIPWQPVNEIFGE